MSDGLLERELLESIWEELEALAQVATDEAESYMRENRFWKKRRTQMEMLRKITNVRRCRVKEFEADVYKYVEYAFEETETQKVERLQGLLDTYWAHLKKKGTSENRDCEFVIFMLKHVSKKNEFFLLFNCILPKS